MRNWLFQINCGYTRNNAAYPTWLSKDIPTEKDNVVLLYIGDEKYDEIESIFKNKNYRVYSETFPECKEDKFREILDKYEINSFFSHATFSPQVLEIRKWLNNQFFDRVLSVWHEGGFLRHVCFQMDWWGWNGYSSLAEMDISNLPALNIQQKEFVDLFMNKRFLAQKILNTEHKYKPLKESKKFNRTALIALQVEKDSVLTNFAPEEYQGREWAFKFVQEHQDTFFIIRDHPKQLTALDKTKGSNWIYIPPDGNINTLTIAQKVDAVVVVNSTVGMESLFWTPVYRAGKTIYSHDELTLPLEDFNTKLDNRDLVYRFLYYVITTFHYTPGISADNHPEWFDKISLFRKTAKKWIKST